MAESTRVQAERKLIYITSPFKIKLLSEETWRFSGGEREIGEAKHANFFAQFTLFLFFCFFRVWFRAGGRDEVSGPRNDVLTTCKAVTLRGGQRIIAVFCPPYVL